MAITTDDFNKIWASTSPLTPYEFSESQYKEGWNFIGGTPPSRQMWDFLQKNNDEKMQYLLNNFDNYLPLSGGTLTGVVNGVTPTAGDNSTKIATTEFVNAKAGNYLPLSGGTMTGSIQYINNGKVFAIGNTTTGNVDLGWNWENRDGAGFWLRSTDDTSSTAGSFSIYARDGSNSTDLRGYPNGSLTWANNEIERVVATAKTGVRYIRFDSGLQMVFGSVNATQSGTTVNFPAPFDGTNYYVLSSAGGYTITTGHTSETSTSIKITSSVSNGAWVYFYAVGWWK